MSSTLKSRSTAWLISIVISFVCSCASATRDTTTFTISTAQPKTDPAQNECMGDSMGANCLGTDQLGTSYSYNPHSDNEISVANGFEIGRYLEDTHDRLSERDQLVYASKDANFWKASDQDTLRQVLFVHRHGDRTPVQFPPKDSLAGEPFWQFHGLSQLTNRGKARLHLLGKIIRQRYNTFLNGSVNKNILKTRASGSLRCIESAQVFLSSFLSLETSNSPDASALVWDKQEDKLSQIWQPSSVLTLAAKYDGLLNEGAACKILHDEYDKLDVSEENKRLSKEFKHEAGVMRSELGFDIDHFYKWFWGDSQLEVERSYFAAKMKPALLAISDRMQKASDRALVLLQSTLTLRRGRAGLLINDILENMKEMRAGSQSTFTKKFVHYSGHDITLIFVLGLLDNIEKYPYRPDYASNIAFELHQDKDEWFVRFFYMPHVPSKPYELHIEACESGHPRGRCTLDRFEALMQKYRIASWMDWMKECGNSLDSFNPYDQNA